MFHSIRSGLQRLGTACSNFLEIPTVPCLLVLEKPIFLTFKSDDLCSASV